MRSVSKLSMRPRAFRAGVASDEATDRTSGTVLKLSLCWTKIRSNLGYVWIEGPHKALSRELQRIGT